MRQISPNFWQQKFESQQTGWDRGEPNPQLLWWIEHQEIISKDYCRIAVPGCGKGWEVMVLSKAGFEVTAIDYTPAAVAETRAKLELAGLSATIVQENVLSFKPNKPFDAIYEQTCLCALHPADWLIYSRQLTSWLRPGGRLYILWMQVIRSGSQKGLLEGPPFHCDATAMRALFDDRYWKWPKMPLTQVPHKNGLFELACILERI